jgi:hypothetical protein
MGQASIFTLNKVGYSMFWSSMWDDKINYSRSLKEDIFFRNFIEIFFETKSSFKFLKKNYFFLKTYSYNFFYVVYFKFSYKELEKYLLNIRRGTYFFSKFWILKYQYWFIIYFYILNFKEIEKYNQFVSFKSNNINILTNFYINIIKIDHNYKILQSTFKNIF